MFLLNERFPRNENARAGTPEPYPRSGVSAERRWLLFPRIAALCRDAATPGFMVPMCGWKTVGTTHDQVAADVTPEEFGFRILSHSQQLDLAFGERDPIRKLSGVDLEKVLLELIKKQSFNTNI